MVEAREADPTIIGGRTIVLDGLHKLFNKQHKHNEQE